MPKSHKKGFTMVELLIAITIIGILSSMITYGLIGQQRKARDAKRKSDLSQIKRALQSAKNDCRGAAYYPIGTPSGSVYAQNQFNDLQNHLTSLKYMNSTVADPSLAAGANLSYGFAFLPTVANVCPDASGTMNVAGTTDYKLYAKLELSDDPEAPASTSKCSNASVFFQPATYSVSIATNKQAYLLCND